MPITIINLSKPDFKTLFGLTLFLRRYAAFCRPTLTILRLIEKTVLQASHISLPTVNISNGGQKRLGTLFRTRQTIIDIIPFCLRILNKMFTFVYFLFIYLVSYLSVVCRKPFSACIVLSDRYKISAAMLFKVTKLNNELLPSLSSCYPVAFYHNTITIDNSGHTDEERKLNSELLSSLSSCCLNRAFR